MGILFLLVRLRFSMVGEKTSYRYSELGRVRYAIFQMSIV